MKPKYASLIRDGIMQARQFEYIKDVDRRVNLVENWAHSMYCYGEIMASKSAFLIARSMVTYTKRKAMRGLTP